MPRLAYPLVLLAALSAGRARAQDGDRYGPRPAPPAGGAAPMQVALRSGGAPALRPAAPMPRSLSWPGKVELRQALAPEGEGPALIPPAPAPRPSTYALRSAPMPTGRFPGLAAYGTAAPAPVPVPVPVPVPALRPAATPYANVPTPSSTWPAATRTVRRREAAAANPPSAGAPQPVHLPSAATPPAPLTASDARTGGRAQGSNLPRGLAAPPAYVPAGPAYGPALAAQARDQARASADATADTLPPPTVGRYGYVGPGRAASSLIPSPPTEVASAPLSAAAPAPAPPTTSAAGLGPPRPPAFARGYVMPAQPPTSGAPAAVAPAPGGVAAARTLDGARRYSVHREYGMEPDPMPVPPQFFAASPDLSAPETPPAAPRNSKAAVNAARLAAAGG